MYIARRALYLYTAMNGNPARPPEENSLSVPVSMAKFAGKRMTQRPRPVRDRRRRCTVFTDAGVRR